MYWQAKFNNPIDVDPIEEEIKKIFHKLSGRYGYRRITDELRNEGHIVNSKKVRRIMNKLNLKCVKYTRKSRKFST